MNVKSTLKEVRKKDWKALLLTIFFFLLSSPNKIGSLSSLSTNPIRQDKSDRHKNNSITNTQFSSFTYIYRTSCDIPSSFEAT